MTGTARILEYVNHMGRLNGLINSIGRKLLLSVNLLFLCGGGFTFANDFQKLDRVEKFWLKKPHYKDEIFKDRKIFVSAVPHGKAWHFKGVGGVKTDLDQTWMKSLKFEELKRASNFLQEVTYDSKDKILKLNVVILSKSLFLKLQLSFDQKTTARERVIDVVVLEGPLKTAVGKIFFLDSLSQGTQIEALGFFEGTVPFADVVFKLAIESAMKYVAQIMRTYIEQGE
jgi:hypothetical protein